GEVDSVDRTHALELPDERLDLDAVPTVLHRATLATAHGYAGRRMRRLWLLAFVVVVAGGCGSKATVTVTTVQRVTVPPGTTTTGQSARTVRVYFMRDGKVGSVARSLETVDRASLLAAVAAGPTRDERDIGFTQGEATERTAEEVYTLSQFD